MLCIKYLCHNFVLHNVILISSIKTKKSYKNQHINIKIKYSFCHKYFNDRSNLSGHKKTCKSKNINAKTLTNL